MTTMISSMPMLSVWTDPRITVDNPAPNAEQGSTIKISRMQLLWDRLDGMMPGMWAANFNRQGSIRNWGDAWATEFARVNLTDAEISRGIGGVSAWNRKQNDFGKGKLDVGTFIDLCRPQMSDEDAFYEAVANLGLRRRPRFDEENNRMVTDDVWTEPAIYWAAIATAGDIMSASSFKVVSSRWGRALEYARKHPKGPVPVYALQIAAPKPCTIGEAEQKTIIAGMMAKLGKSGVAGATRGSKMSLSRGSDLQLAERKRETAKALAELEAAAAARKGESEREGANTDSG